MTRKVLVFLLATLLLGFGVRAASADALSLRVTSELRNDLPLLVDDGDGFPEDRELMYASDLNFRPDLGDCLRIWQAGADRPPVRTGCNRPPLKFIAECNTVPPVVCALSVRQTSRGELDYGDLTLTFLMERHPPGAGMPCRTLARSAGRAKIFAIDAGGLKCGRARAILGKWRRGEFSPEIGPRGWECSTTLRKRRTLDYRCRKGNRKIGFSRFAT